MTTALLLSILLVPQQLAPCEDGSVHGTVRGPDASEAVVAAVSGGREVARVAAGPDGSFALCGLVQGRLLFVTAETAAGFDEAAVTIPRSGSLRIDLALEYAEPVVAVGPSGTRRGRPVLVSTGRKDTRRSPRRTPVRRDVSEVAAPAREYPAITPASDPLWPERVVLASVRETLPASQPGSATSGEARVARPVTTEMPAPSAGATARPVTTEMPAASASATARPVTTALAERPTGGAATPPATAIGSADRATRIAAETDLPVAYRSPSPRRGTAAAPAGPRTVHAEGVTIYYAAGLPVYLRLEPRGPGACVLEYDGAALSGQGARRTAGGSLLVGRSFGSVVVSQPAAGRIELDLSRVSMPRCTMPGRVVLTRSGRSWTSREL